ncbi:hypothetical protein JWG42_11400 [Desulfoprunum benzoelyticum]|uniref:CULT domain-containing protein n=1 Tax=Desulfoprunum benzoelyticum TaxID=1506996 RepID=A0A840UNJ1_9BACT|nr:cereblon family protein [Desulfoprunum benzoelyticum]MBB5347342.1 hypothetical protein [Desulfoprunum benzoelyticum]MBM9530756.1 hypothetical protein [Desulfoprunum benzoelyticum]
MDRENLIDGAGRPHRSIHGGDRRRYLLRELPAGGWEADVLAADREEDRAEEDPGVSCRVCAHRITGDTDRIAVNGSHTHTFFNPAGLLFELGCFRRAPGCLVSGEASDQFTWFAGYLWRPAFCAYCAAHLGWRFEKEGHAFFSLILANLHNG